VERNKNPRVITPAELREAALRWDVSLECARIWLRNNGDIIQEEDNEH